MVILIFLAQVSHIKHILMKNSASHLNFIQNEGYLNINDISQIVCNLIKNNLILMLKVYDIQTEIDNVLQ